MISEVEDPARTSLSDNGRGKWDEKVPKFLDKHYVDWKEPSGTYMVPMMFPSHNKNNDFSGYESEKRTFDLLQASGTNCNEPMFVVHSHKFSEFEYLSGEWVKGEHDFVLLHHQLGVIFMQVKAGINKYDQAEKQLKKDEESIKIFLYDSLRIPPEIVGEFTRGFVVMPNCPISHSSGAVGVFQEDCQSVAAFSAWWENNVKNTPVSLTAFTQTIYEHLVQRLVMDHLLLR